MYGGTKAELERLVEDANTYKEAMGEVGDLTSDNFADVVEAIHVVQTEMGITGTTAEEAATTIEGSVNTMKAAWENWLTALGREDVDMSEMTDKLVDSVVTALENIIPRAVKIMESLGETLAEKGPEIAQRLGDALADAIPDSLEPALDAITKVFTNLVVPVTGAVTAFGTLKKAMSTFDSASTLTKKSATKLYDAFLDLATSPKTAGTAVGKLASIVAEFPGATALAAAGVAVLVTGIVSFIDTATEAQREAETEAEALEVLGDAANVASGSMTQASDGTEQLGTAISELHDDIQQNWQDIADLADTFDEIDQSANASIYSLQSAKQAISEYAGQTDLTTQQQGLLVAAVDQLNDACGTSYTVAQDAGGAYQVMADGATVAKDEIYNLIDAQIKQAQIDAQTEKLKDLYSQQAEQAQDYAEAVAQLKDAQEEYNDQVQKYIDKGYTLEQAMGISGGALDKVEEAEDNLAEVQEQLDATGESIEGVSESIGNLEAASSGAVEGFDALVQGSIGLNTIFEETGEDMDDFAADLENTGVSLETFAGLTDSQLMQIAASWDGSTQSIIEALEEMGVEVPNSASAAMEALNIELSEGGQEAVATAMSVAGLTAQQFADKVSEYGLSGEESITAFANAIAAGDTYDVAAQKAQQAAEGMGSAKSEASSEGSATTSSFADGISSGTGKVDTAASKVSNAAEGMEDVGDMKQSGTDIVKNFAAGISGAVSIVKGAASTIANAVHSVLGFSVPDKGPWSGAEKGGERSGRHLVENFAEGMRSARGDVEDAAMELAEAAEIRAVPVGDAVADYLRYSYSRYPADAAAAGQQAVVQYITNDNHQDIAFNQPVQTPDEITRTMRMQQRYGLAGAR